MADVFKAEMLKLEIHPLAQQIYNYRRNRRGTIALSETMKRVGQLEPILINSSNQILSGNRRFQAAQILEWPTIDAILYDGDDETEEIKRIVFHNQQREKTKQEIINEAEALLGILGKKQGARRDLLGDNPSQYCKIGQDRFETAALVIGNISGSSLRRMMAVVEFEKKDRENEKLGLVERIIRKQLKPSAAYNLMKSFMSENEEKERRKNVKLNTKLSPENLPQIYNKSSEKMTEVKANSIQVVFTSPPYYNLRSYGNSAKGKRELGHESTPQEFVINLSKHLRDVKRVLKKTGSFFLNIGESYNNGENLLISTRLLLQLCDKEGWFLVNEIIWQKTNPIPQANKKRLQPTYEKIFHLVKDPENYYYKEFKNWNGKESKVVQAPKNRVLATGKNEQNKFTLSKGYQKFKDFIDEQSVVGVISGPNAGNRQAELKKIDRTKDHPALMPDYLPVIPILTTSQEGDIILDPFSGSATTGKTSLLLGRKYVGYELNRENYEQSKLAMIAAFEELNSIQ